MPQSNILCPSVATELSPGSGRRGWEGAVLPALGLSASCCPFKRPPQWERVGVLLPRGGMARVVPGLGSVPLPPGNTSRSPSHFGLFLSRWPKEFREVCTCALTIPRFPQRRGLSLWSLSQESGDWGRQDCSPGVRPSKGLWGAGCEDVAPAPPSAPTSLFFKLLCKKKLNLQNIFYVS